MKPRWIITLLLVLQIALAAAQSSQQGVLLQQIAALRVYGDYLQKGYGIIEDGLNTIGGLKEGELNLHSDYFISLSHVNPRLAGSEMIARIIELQQKIIIAGNGIYQGTGSEFLSDIEIAYCQRVEARLLESCTEELEYLTTILTDQALVMEDAQRLEAIQRICKVMQGNYAFAKEFSNDIRLLVRDRERAQREVHKSKQLNNIN